jgi:hypothetical protein
MGTSSAIPDDAIVLRHIPGGSTFQQPPSHRITSRNFQLRADEDGVSVSLSSTSSMMADATAMLRRLKTAVESKIGFASVRDVRKLGFDVVPAQTKDDPMHSIIVSGTRKLDNHLDRKFLASLFQYASPPSA